MDASIAVQLLCLIVIINISSSMACVSYFEYLFKRWECGKEHVKIVRTAQP